MDEQRYLINGKVYAPDHPGLQEALARVYDTPARPRCLCVDGGVEMYVSKFRDFVIKRMPESGTRHAPTCPSFELPPNESGLGQLLGDAIIDRGTDGVELRLDFPLTRYQGRSQPYRRPEATVEVAVARKQLSLRGLLHYLWERAGFNRWYPRMQGKRTYAVVRRFLLEACEEVQTKGLRLSERVFIPERFQLERAGEIAIRHREALAPLLLRRTQARFNLMIALGELKTFSPTAAGHRLMLKHLPEGPLFLDGSTSERAKRLFEHELVAWSNGRVRLVTACLIRAKNEHSYAIEALALMTASPQWIPLECAGESDVVAKLVAEERVFMKPLRYDTAASGPFPNFLLLDAGARPVALDIVSSFLGDAERATKLSAIAARGPKGWVWDTARDAAVPELPPRALARTH